VAITNGEGATLRKRQWDCNRAKSGGRESREAEGLDVLLPWQHLEGVDVQGGRAEQTGIITTPANHGERLERLGTAPAPSPCHAMVTVRDATAHPCSPQLNKMRIRARRPSSTYYVRLFVSGGSSKHRSSSPGTERFKIRRL
jgi:hypothetical protein